MQAVAPGIHFFVINWKVWGNNAFARDSYKTLHGY